MIEIVFQRLHPDARLPSYATPGAAGMDLAAIAASSISPGNYAVIPTGLAVEIPPGWEGQVRPRSGHAARNGVTVLNSPGTIDADYRGEIQVLLVNFGKEAFQIEVGMRIAQLVIASAPQATVRFGDDLSQSDRGSGGFGSTSSS
ncbi:deoxyuridine 5'-triphosphate nucleotidohydrolase Dut [Rhizobium leguminosarum bv. trifolii WSM2297]|uniref:Deoxyuridine 5'-triphosphate nucleotidohydrolase n=1 Tax=Rhizobium leguminosarum bv. trifolii WSM2297 TaxID=754762 RepID=J0CCC5_RHILT|nr:dUTP diphosphatase [Rhizobium leguminosarum]EJC80802.1 deoxyuridine 5'-triphosphate nucleotidohydrolase Dut [Rhizobium leguminosarum bv. trifolii WSM2297]